MKRETEPPAVRKFGFSSNHPCVEDGCPGCSFCINGPKPLAPPSAAMQQAMAEAGRRSIVMDDEVYVDGKLQWDDRVPALPKEWALRSWHFASDHIGSDDIIIVTLAGRAEYVAECSDLGRTTLRHVRGPLVREDDLDGLADEVVAVGDGYPEVAPHYRRAA